MDVIISNGNFEQILKTILGEKGFKKLREENINIYEWKDGIAP